MPRRLGALRPDNAKQREIRVTVWQNLIVPDIADVNLEAALLEAD